MANWEPLCAIIGLRGTVFLVTEVRLSKCLGTMEVKLLPPPQKKKKNPPSYLLEASSLSFCRKPDPLGIE